MDSLGVRDTRASAAEIKFVIPRSTGLAIRDWARRHLDRDPHGTGPHGDEYETSTIYFETAAYDVFNRRRSFGRSKYRIRRYDGADAVFLERKLRRPGMLTKRRTLVPVSLLPQIEQPERAAWAGDWFHRRLLLRGLRPVCELTYARMARAGGNGSQPLRLTLDDRLSVGRTNRPLFDVAGETTGIVEGSMILELKFRGEIPALFKQLVDEFRLEPRPTSKYRFGIAALLPENVRSPMAGVAAGAPAAASGSL